MTKLKSYNSTERTAWIYIAIAIGFILLLFIFKNSMSNFVASQMKKQESLSVQFAIQQYLDSAYNYTQNEQSYSITFVEFGATGCSSCRKMEKVMSDVKAKYPNQVKVVFYNILLEENQRFMKYFSVAAIPTQVLLDKNGKEFYRHVGYLSFFELEKFFN